MTDPTGVRRAIAGQVALLRQLADLCPDAVSRRFEARLEGRLSTVVDTLEPGGVIMCTTSSLVKAMLVARALNLTTMEDEHGH